MGARELIKNTLKKVRVEYQGKSNHGFVASVALLDNGKAIKEVSKFEVKARFRIQPVTGEFLLKSGEPFFMDATSHVWKSDVMVKLYCKNPSRELKDFISYSLKEIKANINQNKKPKQSLIQVA